MTTMIASPSLDAATRRLFYCMLASLLLHIGLTKLKPGAVFGLDTPPASVTRVPAVFEVRLARQPQVLSGYPPVETAAREAALALPQESGAITSPLPALETPSQQALPPVANGMFVGPWYYAAQYLHRRPSPLQPIRPDYPALTDNEPHTVRLLMLISAAGTVDSYRVSGEKNTLFARTVIDAFTTVDYAPGIIANIPVKSQLLVEVTFHPGDGSFHANMVVPDGANLQLPSADRPGL